MNIKVRAHTLINALMDYIDIINAAEGLIYIREIDDNPDGTPTVKIFRREDKWTYRERISITVAPNGDGYEDLESLCNTFRMMAAQYSLNDITISIKDKKFTKELIDLLCRE